MGKSPQQPEPGNAPLLIGYARVSTKEQNLDLQTDALIKAGVHRDHLYEEKRSAVKVRPQLDLAIKDLRPGETLIVWRIDRLARNMEDLYARLRAIKEQGGKFRSLQEDFDFGTYMGEFVLGIFGLVAQLESQLTAHRTAAGIKALQERGGRYGRTPTVDAKLKPKIKAMLLQHSNGKPTHKVRAVAAHFKLAVSSIYGHFTIHRCKSGKRIVKLKAR